MQLSCNDFDFIDVLLSAYRLFTSAMKNSEAKTFYQSNFLHVGKFQRICLHNTYTYLCFIALFVLQFPHYAVAPRRKGTYILRMFYSDNSDVVRTASGKNAIAYLADYSAGRASGGV